MSSVVAQGCTQGFVISTDSAAMKEPVGEGDRKLGRIGSATRKLFQVSDDVLVGAVGQWTSYLPLLNAAARSPRPAADLVPALLGQCEEKACDARLFVLYRIDGKALLDTAELGQIRRERSGAVAYPNQTINGLFRSMYESPEGLAIRKTGLLGITGLVLAFNAMAASLSPEISPPFDTVLFLDEGQVVVSGGITRLPVTEYW